MNKKILNIIIMLVCVFNLNAQLLQPENLRIKLITNLYSQLDVREVGYNRGPMVSKYLKSVGARPGDPWCGAFVGYNLTNIGVKNPNSAYSPDYARKKDVIWKSKKRTKVKLLPGDVVTYYFPNLRRVGHVGFLERIDNDGYFLTIEGNTNGAGSREGDGVYKKKRSPSKVHAVSRYIK